MYYIEIWKMVNTVFIMDVFIGSLFGEQAMFKTAENCLDFIHIKVTQLGIDNL